MVNQTIHQSQNDIILHTSLHYLEIMPTLQISQYKNKY